MLIFFLENGFSTLKEVLSFKNRFKEGEIKEKTLTVLEHSPFLLFIRLKNEIQKDDLHITGEVIQTF